MEQFIIYLSLVILGLSFGSFAGATVWRLRARQLRADKKAGEEIDSSEYKLLAPLMDVKQKDDRSRCLHCGHQLAWYDLIPVLSWLSIGGKCRYCRHAIGRFEPVIEIGTVIFFVASYLLWPYDLNSSLAISQFAVWLAAGVGLAILFAYDFKWFLLPNSVMFSVIGLASVSAILTLLQATEIGLAFINMAGAVAILSGLYLLIYVISKGMWVGFGDVKLGLALALLLADWRLALLALFLANLIGCLIVIPGMVTQKITRQTRIPFGPLMIVGAVLALFFGDTLLNWYFNSLF